MSSLIDEYCFQWNNRTIYPLNVPSYLQHTNVNSTKMCHLVAGLFFNEVIFSCYLSDKLLIYVFFELGLHFFNL